MAWIPLIIFVIEQILKLVGKTDGWKLLPWRQKEVVAAIVADKYRAQIGDGSLLKWLWENREQIIEFVLTIIDMFDGEDDVSISATCDVSMESLCAMLE